MTDTLLRDGMKILFDVEIPASDGTVLRGDVFLPAGLEGQAVPVLASYGCYAKGQSFQEAYANQWARMVEDFPEIEEMTSGLYQCWELTDPELWVPHGYAVLRVDSRGSGTSEGVQDAFSLRETQDYYDVVEWAAAQGWSNGKVGLLGISYYAVNQWMVASMQPPHLAAMIPWEGASDAYRELYYHGGIRSQFVDMWLPRQLPMQYGYGDRGRKSVVTGANVAGAVTLSDEALRANRTDKVSDVLGHPLDDEYYAGCAADWSKVTVPFLSAANWGGAGLHLRGNVEAFTQAASQQKWLEVHGLEHWVHFYSPYGVSLQKEFFDHFLMGKDNGWDQRKPVQLQVRHIEHFEERFEDAWPLPSTEWTDWHLDAAIQHLGPATPAANAATSYAAIGDGVTFRTRPMTAETEITGPLSARLFISSDTVDADLFLALRLFDPSGAEVVFRSAMDAHGPVAQGWLRASHRKIDPARSTPYRPWHTHDDPQPLVPHEVTEVEVEIWPTSIVVPAGYSIGLTVRGTDYVYDGPRNPVGECHRYPSRGCGPFLHACPEDRPPAVFANTVTIYSGPKYPSRLLTPVIPPRVS